MQGATFTISSLGGIGGTSFTPIVNAPEVAILGVTRSAMKPVWDGARVRAAADGAAVALLRPPRDRRRARRALRRAPGRPCCPTCGGCCCDGGHGPRHRRLRPTSRSSRSSSPPGDEVAAEDPLVTLESDKATMDVPVAGRGQGRASCRSRSATGLRGQRCCSRSRRGRRRRRRAGRRSAPAEEAPSRSRRAARGRGRRRRRRPGRRARRRPGRLHGRVPRRRPRASKIVLVERDERLGGVCLNVGCIPSKALLHVAQRDRPRPRSSATHGIAFGEPEIDLDGCARWKDGVVGQAHRRPRVGLAKQRKVEVVRGARRVHRPEHDRRSATRVDRLRALHHRRRLGGGDAARSCPTTRGSSTRPARSSSRDDPRAAAGRSAAGSSAWRWRRSTTRSARRSPSSSCSTS